MRNVVLKRGLNEGGSENRGESKFSTLKCLGSRNTILNSNYMKTVEGLKIRFDFEC